MQKDNIVDLTKNTGAEELRRRSAFDLMKYVYDLGQLKGNKNRHTVI